MDPRRVLAGSVTAVAVWWVLGFLQMRFGGGMANVELVLTPAIGLVVGVLAGWLAWRRAAPYEAAGMDSLRVLAAAVVTVAVTWVLSSLQRTLGGGMGGLELLLTPILGLGLGMVLAWPWAERKKRQAAR